MKLLQRMKSKKGFTLVEMVLVIAILAVILAFAVPGVDSYVKRIKLMELDDSARSIFMAAQNKLMTLRSSGKSLNFDGAKLVELENVPEDFRKDNDGNLLDFADSKNPPKFSYIYFNYSDVKNSNPEKLVDDSNIINLGAIEDQIYTNEFVIEYDAATGTVFGVFYTEDDGALEDYDPENMERGFEERLEAGGTIGYYGGGTLVEVPVGEEITTPIIKNGAMEKLVVYVEWPDGFDEAEKLYFTLSIVGPEKGAASNMQTVEIISKDDSCYITKDNYSTIILDSLAPGLSSDNGQWDIPSDAGDHNLSYPFVLERDFKGWVLKKNLVFDSERGVYYPKYKGKMWQGAEMEGTEWLRDDYPMDPQDNGSSSEGQGYPGSNTNSNYIINPGSDITVYVTFYDKSGVYKDIPTVKPYPVNSYFNALDGTTAKIAAGRHLQNLSNYVLQDTVSDVFIEHDIDFSKSPDSDTDPEKKNVYYYWNADETYNRYYDFKPIGSQFVKNATFLKNFDGNGCTISYLKIDSDAHHFPENSSGYENTAFITDLLDSGRMSNITFYRPWIIGKTINTAVFVGKATAGTNFHNITIINPIVEGGVEGVESYVGTLCADYNCNGGIEKCNVVITDYSNDYDFSYEEVVVEGETLKEYVNESGKHYQDSLDWGDPTNDPYKKFYIKGLTATTYAGGLLGRSSGTLNGTSCSIRVESEGIAGGLVGVIDGGTVNNNYVGGHTYNGSYIVKTDDGIYSLINIDGKVASGGFIGELRGGISMTTDSSTASVAYSNGYGDGFIGKALSSDKFNNSYALGWVIDADSNKVVSKSSKYVADIRNVNNAVTSQAEPYDKSLGNIYPYSNDNTFPVRVGDWPVDPPLFGIFYWEKDSAGNYNIDTIYYNCKDGSSDPSIEPTLQDIDIAEFGYGYYYTSAVKSGNESMMEDVGSAVSNDDITKLSGIIEEKLADKNIIITPTVVAKKTSGDAYTAPNGERQSITFSYDDKQITFTYHPDFYALEMTEGTSTLGEVKGNPYKVRCQKQLENISSTPDGVFKQHRAFDLNESYKPICTDGYFTGIYGGGDYEIRANSISHASNAVGIFAKTRSATIENVNVSYSGTVSLGKQIENGQKAGVGGIVGIAIGGVLNNCSVSGMKFDSTSATKLQSGTSLAVGGIVGYSSATIRKCDAPKVQSANSIPTNPIQFNFRADTTNTLIAFGGIAGSASGIIENCSITNLETEFEDNADNSLLIAGGIVGNNVDYLGRTTLSVSGCYSNAKLTRPSGINSEGKTTFESNVLIHPIAPTHMHVVADDPQYYSNISDADAYKGKVYEFNTGTGLKSEGGELDVTITDCSAMQGQGSYNSLVWGNEAVTASKDGETSKIPYDVYIAEPPKNIHAVVYERKVPTVGIYALYEKTDGVNNSALAAKIIDNSVYSGSTTNNQTIVINEDTNVESKLDPLHKYGIFVDFGRFEEISVKVNGVPQTISLTSLKDMDGKTLHRTENGQYIDIDVSSALNLNNGENTITIVYKENETTNSEICTYTINVPAEREPYAGVYELYQQGDTTHLDAIYNDGKNKNQTVKHKDGDIKLGKCGVMIEHFTSVNPRNVAFTAEISYTENGEQKTISNADYVLVDPSHIGNDGEKARANGKYFDFYEISDEVYSAIPEDTDYTIKVIYSGKAIAEGTFHKDVKVPYLGIYGAMRVRNKYNMNDESLIDDVATAVISNSYKISKTYNNMWSGNYSENYDKYYGTHIMVERGADISKIELTLTKLDKSTQTVEVKPEYKVENAAYILVGAPNSATVSFFEGLMFDSYKLPDDVIQDVAEISATYICSDGKTTQTVNAKILDDLKGEIIGHEHKFGAYESVDNNTHKRTCEVCGFVETSPHNWDDGVKSSEHEGKLKFTCEICKATKEDDDKYNDKMLCVGFYSIYYQNSDSASIAWYNGLNGNDDFTVENKYDEKLSPRAAGDVGILIDSQYKDLISVYVDGEKIDTAKLTDNWNNNISEAQQKAYKNKYGDSYPSLSSYKIPLELNGELSVTITVKYSEYELFTKEVEVQSPPTVGVYRIYATNNGSYYAYGKKSDDQFIGSRDSGWMVATNTYGLVIEESKSSEIKNMEIRAGGGTISLSESNKCSISNTWQINGYKLIEFSEEITEGTTIEIIYNGETLMTLNSNDI